MKTFTDSYAQPEFQKVEMPELAQILANVDTVSSTEIWEKLKDEAASKAN